MVNMSISNARSFIVYQILQKESSFDHPLSTTQLISKLSEYGISVDRTTLYRDIAALNEVVDDDGKIEIRHDSNKNGYYIYSSMLEPSEAKILLDLIHATQALSKKKTNEIEMKIKSLIRCDDYDRISIQQLTNRNKTRNEALRNNIEMLIEPIATHHFIQFKYFDYSSKRTKVYRRNGEYYRLLPYNLFIQNDRYYCIGYNPNHHDLTHFRLDKMDHILIEDMVADKYPLMANVQTYIGQTISLFNGPTRDIQLMVKPSLISVVMDQFSECMIMDEKEDLIQMNVTIHLNKTFYAWISNFRPDEVRISGPNDVVYGYTTYLNEIMSAYKAF